MMHLWWWRRRLVDIRRTLRSDKSMPSLQPVTRRRPLAHAGLVVGSAALPSIASAADTASPSPAVMNVVVVGAHPGDPEAGCGGTVARYGEFTKRLTGLAPDVVLTQWPVDTHRDHRTCAALTLDANLAAGQKFALYDYEVDLGSDTQCFRPTDYVDVTSTEKLKRAACMAHQSQKPDNFYTKDHEPMLRFRGMESGCKAADAFVHYAPSPRGRLPSAA
jgi:LmbE family N-acetylglucosaminyl deacetylase